MSTRPAFHRVAAFMLSTREMEVAKALARGETITEIAKRLQINVSAVGNYRRHAQEKLGLYNRFQLAAYAREAGWV